MDSPDEWWQRIEGKRAVASVMKEDRHHAVEAWDACGTAVEFALKAYILKRERWNRWPDRSERPDLFAHDLQKLMRIAALSPDRIPRDRVAVWKTVLSWSREHEYRSGHVPRRQARQMFDNTFGPAGVVEWLKSL